MAKKLNRSKIAAKGWATRRAKARNTPRQNPAPVPPVLTEAQGGLSGAIAQADDIFIKRLIAEVRGANDDMAVKMIKSHVDRERRDSAMRVGHEQRLAHRRLLLRDFLAEIATVDRIRGSEHQPIMVSFSTAKAIEAFISRHYTEIYDSAVNRANVARAS